MNRSRRWRYLPLLVFLGLLAAPAWMTSVAIGLGLAVGAFRMGRLIARGLRGRRGTPRGEIALGSDRHGRPVTVSQRDLSAHALILGASGSGKTTSLSTILEQQIRLGRPVVAIDLKGSPAFANRLAAAAADVDRPFRLWTPDGPSHWNPLAHGNPTELKDKLIGTERFTEPHYQRAAERYLQSVLQVIQHNHPERPPALAEVVALMDPRRVRARLRNIPTPLAQRVQDYLAGLTSDQLSAIRGLQTRLAILTESEAGPYLATGRGNSHLPPGSGGSIDVTSALAGGEVILFSLNSSRYGQLAAQLGTLAVQDLIAASGGRLDQMRQGHALEQATVAIDEFSGIGSAHLVALFARGREAGLSVLVATQEMADLDRAGRGVRDQILGNTALKLILRQDVPESADLVAQMAGTEKVWEESRQIGGTIFRGYPTTGTRREAEQFIVHPNEIKSLQTGDALLISKLRGDRARTIRVTPPGQRATGAAPRRGELGRPAPGAGQRPGAPGRPAPGAGPQPERGGPELG